MNDSLPPVAVFREGPSCINLVHSRRDVPLVTIELRIPGGRALEPSGMAGLASLAADLLGEGLSGCDPLEWRRTLDGLAADIRLTAQRDCWALAIDCLAEDLERVAGLAADLLARPGLHRSEWSRIVREHRAGAREEWAQPGSVLGKFAGVQSLGLTHPYAHPASERSIRRARYSEACRMVMETFTGGGAGGMVFGSAGGDLSTDQGLAVLRRLADSMGVRPAVTVELPAPVATPTEAIWVLDHPKVDQAFFVLARGGFRGGRPDRVALRLANYLIGSGGFESRLMTRVREEQGGTYTIRSSLEEGPVELPFRIQSFTSIANLSSMLGLIEREFELICQHGFADRELELARRYAHGSLPMSLTSPRAVLCHAMNGFRLGLSPETQLADWHSTAMIPSALVEQAARELIGDGRFRLAVLGPAKAIVPQVECRGEVRVFKFGQDPERWH